MEANKPTASWTLVKVRAYTLGFIGGQTTVYIVSPSITPDEADLTIQNHHSSVSSVYYRKGWSPLDKHPMGAIYDYSFIKEIHQFGIYRMTKDSKGNIELKELGYAYATNGEMINYDPYAFARPSVTLKARMKVED